MKKQKNLLKGLVLSFFLVMTILQVAAQKVTLNFRDVPFEKVLNSIKRQTGLALVFSDQLVDVNRKVSIDVNSIDVKEALSRLLAETNVGFEINNNKLYLIEKRELHNLNSNNHSVSRRVTGKITDENGLPLPGVTILLQGTAKGAIADSDGEYVIDDVPINSLLQFSFTGMQTQTVPTKGRSRVDISLTDNAINMKELVVVGYGTQKKSDITGAVSSVKASELISAPSTSTAQALQGRVSGVMVQNSSGSPSGDVTIRIRGANSLTYGNDPLIIIDGVQGGNIGNLNPNDIESMEVLKDASALSIYGSRGANGVIIVTTKTGKSGAPKVSLSSYVGFDKVRRELPALQASEYGSLVNQYRKANGQSSLFTDSEIESLGKGTNWQDQIFKAGFTQNHTLSVSGQNSGISYYISGNMVDKTGIVINSDYKQYTLRSNLKVEAAKWLNFRLNSFYSYDVAKHGDYEHAITSALQ